MLVVSGPSVCLSGSHTPIDNGHMERKEYSTISPKTKHLNNASIDTIPGKGIEGEGVRKGRGGD